jgi:hypothetical protein
LCCRAGNNIRKFTPGGIVTRVANADDVVGNAGDAASPSLQAPLRLGDLNGLAFDQHGLLVCDAENKKLRRIVCNAS